jgi:hypothetical protein
MDMVESPGVGAQCVHRGVNRVAVIDPCLDRWPLHYSSSCGSICEIGDAFQRVPSPAGPPRSIGASSTCELPLLLGGEFEPPAIEETLAHRPGDVLHRVRIGDLSPDRVRGSSEIAARSELLIECCQPCPLALCELVPGDEEAGKHGFLRWALMTFGLRVVVVSSRVAALRAEPELTPGHQHEDDSRLVVHG